MVANIERLPISKALDPPLEYKTNKQNTKCSYSNMQIEICPGKVTTKKFLLLLSELYLASLT